MEKLNHENQKEFGHGKVKQESGGCYFCGGLGADYTLYSRPQPTGPPRPFFPFLEQHHLGRLGEVPACGACHGALLQQWDIYERNGATQSKRQYWLKGRALEAPFASSHSSPVAGTTFGAIDNFHSSLGSDALDLSQRPSLFSNGAASPVCYVCGEESSDGHLVQIFAKPNSLPNSPFFPFLGAHPKPPKAKSMEPITGKVLSCEGCYKSLLSQWTNFQQLNVPIPDRSYHIAAKKEAPAIIPPSADKFNCFTCGLEYPLVAQRSVYSMPGPHGIIHFSFLEKLPPAPNALPLSKSGRALVCSLCYKSLQRQHQVFEVGNVPESKRVYKVPLANDHSDGGGGSMLRQHLSNSNHHPPTPAKFPCYLCGNLTENLNPVDSLPQEAGGRMFFPFIKDHHPPPSAKPIDNTGKVLVCTPCYANLKNQWNSWENSHRASLRSVEQGLSNIDPRASKSPSMQFSAPSQSIIRGTCPGCYICGRMMLPDKCYALHTQEPREKEMFFPFLRDYISPPSSKPLDAHGRVLVCLSCHQSLKHQWDTFEAAQIPSAQRQYTIYFDDKELTFDSMTTSHKNHNTATLHVQIYPPESRAPLENSEPLLTTVPIHHKSEDVHPLPRIQDPLDQQIPSNPLPISAVCHICGETSHLGFTYHLFTYPPPPGEFHAQPPFFPFLSKLPPGRRPTSNEDSKILACIFCYHSLMAQWVAYESSPLTEDRNAWTRRYNATQYVCYLCGVTTIRKRVRAIFVRDFPFLLDHPRPPGALSLHSGERVVVCLTCSESLTSQWRDYERMKVPLKMRKYNWMVLPPPNADGPYPTSSKDPRIGPDKEDGQGLAGLKPPHYGRAYEAHTSSFAAALRKLARQAADLPHDGVRVASPPVTTSKRLTLMSHHPPPTRKQPMDLSALPLEKSSEEHPRPPSPRGFQPYPPSSSYPYFLPPPPLLPYRGLEEPIYGGLLRPFPTLPPAASSVFYRYPEPMPPPRIKLEEPCLKSSQSGSPPRITAAKPNGPLPEPWSPWRPVHRLAGPPPPQQQQQGDQNGPVARVAPLSKLDLEKPGEDGEEEDEEGEEVEDSYYPVVLTKGPPLPGPPPLRQVEFLATLGLLTRSRRNEVLFELHVKRKRVPILRSPTPEIQEEAPSPLRTPSPTYTEQLAAEQHPPKCSFLASLGLGPTTPTLRAAYREILVVVREDKCRRQNSIRRRRVVYKSESHHQPQQQQGSQERADDPGGGRMPDKRKHDLPPNGLLDAKKLFLSPALNTPPLLPAQQATTRPAQQPTTRAWLSMPPRKVVVVPDTPQDPQTRQFAQQFHESVLLTTRQQLEQKHHHHHTAASSFKWPGIEALLESYELHLAEQRLEREVLTERCQVLRAQNLDLKTQFEALSQHMAELVQRKQGHDEERLRIQGSIDSLKHTLRGFR